MKRFLAMGLATIMTLSMVVGCGNKEKPAEGENVEKTEGEAASEEAKGEKPLFGVCLYKYDDTYISTVRQALESTADGKADLILNDGKGDQGTQNDQVDLLIEKGVDVLLVNMVDAGAAQNVVDKAKKADIPVVFFNREPAADVIKSYEKARFVGTNAKDAGIIQGQIASELWGDGKTYDINGDGKMQYVMLKGEPDNPEAVARTEYAVSTIKDAGIEVEEVGMQVCNWDTGLAQNAMEAWLSKNADIEFVLANNDGMAQGAISALQAIGKNKGEGTPTVPVLGVDATDAAKDLISKGYMAGTVLQDAEGMANTIFALAMNAFEGKEFIDGTNYQYDETGVAVRIPYQQYK